LRTRKRVATLTPNSVSAATRGREVEQVPERPDRIDVARVLPRLGLGEQELGRIPVADLLVLHEHVEDRQLRSVRALGVVVAAVAVLLRGEQLQVRPAAAFRVLGDARERRLGDYHEIAPLRDVRRVAVQGVEHRGAHRAGARHLGAVHEAVGDERVAPLEELRQPHRSAHGFEDVILGHLAAGRQLASLRGDLLGLLAQRQLGFQEAVTSGAILAVLVREFHL
jgi:hypothetical protein